MYHFIGYVVLKEVEGINQTYLTLVSCKVSLLNNLVKGLIKDFFTNDFLFIYQ